MLKSIKRFKLMGYGMIIVGLIASFSWGICVGEKIKDIKSSLKEQIFSSDAYNEFYENEMKKIDEMFESKEISEKKKEEAEENLKDIDFYLNHLSDEEKELYKDELSQYKTAKMDQNMALGLGAGFVLPGLGVVAIAQTKQECDDDEEIER